jgi:uncharacterized protein HemX
MRTNLQKTLGAIAIGSALLLTSGVAYAQTSSTTSSGSTTTTTDTTGTTPTAPNTGAGGDSANNMAVLVTSALVAAAGLGYLARRKSA